ncbi:rhamnogalacturonan acetylesterase [Gracilibacillus timonensis]|uniref:rhamnogalacturonan acetylesterase n=1 Tax=Gracilibacillus timonensis TaxID=1816696 RepID=UPI0008269112|nr:rhamnogalacturonan acetylesterase [Gracilibacillus timonensis]
MTIIRLFLAGDSTMSAYGSDRYPRMGWGQTLTHYLEPLVSIRNHAMSGRSSKSFRTEGRWQEMESEWQPGDYVFIQFGHNDQKSDPERATKPFSSYQANLHFFIQRAKSAQVTPILLTPIARRQFNEHGILEHTHGYYPLAVRKLAAQERVDCIDMLQWSSQLLNELGAEQSKSLFMQLPPGLYPNYPEGEMDDTHLTEAGAEAHCKLCVEALDQIGHPLAVYNKCK